MVGVRESWNTRVPKHIGKIGPGEEIHSSLKKLADDLGLTRYY